MSFFHAALGSLTGLLLLSGSLVAQESGLPPSFTVDPMAESPLPEAFQATTSAWVQDRWVMADPQRWLSRRPEATTWTPETIDPLGRTQTAGVADGAGWLIIGGRTAGGGVSSTVTRLSVVDGRLHSVALLPLPQPRALAGAGILGRTLYVVGGVDAAGNPRAEVQTLALDRPDATWSSAPALPGAPRVLPMVTAHFNSLLVFGGRLSTAAGWTATSEVWAYRIKPQDGMTRTGWMARASLPTALAGGAATTSGSAQVTIVGGDPATTVADPAARSVTPAPSAIYHAVTDAWYSIPAVAPVGSTGVVVDRQPRFLDQATGREFRATPPPTSYQLAWGDYLAIALYFLAMVVIGLRFSGKGESSSEFALGNRSVSWWAAGISMFATGASSISFMAIPAMAFASNLVWFTPVLMMVVSYFVGAYILYPLLRRLELTSTFEYLDRRFDRSLRLLASAQCVIFQTFGRMSVIMVLPALAISAFTGLDVVISVILMGVLTTIYTSIGGFNAVIWTDVFQGALMLLAPILVIALCILGLPGGTGQFVEIGQSYDKFSMAIWSWDLALPCFWMLILGTVVNMAGAVGDQPVIQRIFSVPMQEVRRTTFMFNLCGIVIAVMVFTMGLAIFAFYHARPAMLPPTITNDQIVPWFIVQNLPVGLVGLVIAAIFAAAMSTLSSSMNSVATLVSEDFYKKLRPQATDRDHLRVMQITSYGVGIIGTAMAVYMGTLQVTSMFEVWNKIAALLGGGFVGIYILGIFTTRANALGAWCGGAASILTTIFIDRLGDIHWIHYGPLAVLACVAVGFVVSLLTGGNRKDLTGLTFHTPAQT